MVVSFCVGFLLLVGCSINFEGLLQYFLEFFFSGCSMDGLFLPGFFPCLLPLRPASHGSSNLLPFPTFLVSLRPTRNPEKNKNKKPFSKAKPMINSTQKPEQVHIFMVTPTVSRGKKREKTIMCAPACYLHGYPALWTLTLETSTPLLRGLAKKCRAQQVLQTGPLATLPSQICLKSVDILLNDTGAKPSMNNV